ncbi:MAG: PH domain-containing protein [Candidatus Buchananbacteria bacterium]|nr:PH domain-containing protein [Candidatus Buchananbacteria bacterium]
MYIEKHIPNRQKGENLVLFLRRHWIIIVGHWLFYIFLALIPLGFYFFIEYQFPNLLTTEYTYAFLLLLASIYYLFILLFFYYAFVDYHLDVWIVTNKRIINIEQKGLFNRFISEHELEKIQDVTAEQKGVLATFLSYGNVLVQTAGEVPMFIFRQVDNPFEVAKQINHLLKDIPPEKRIGLKTKEALNTKI